MHETVGEGSDPGERRVVDQSHQHDNVRRPMMKHMQKRQFFLCVLLFYQIQKKPLIITIIIITFLTIKNIVSRNS